MYKSIIDMLSDINFSYCAYRFKWFMIWAISCGFDVLCNTERQIRNHLKPLLENKFGWGRASQSEATSIIEPLITKIEIRSYANEDMGSLMRHDTHYLLLSADTEGKVDFMMPFIAKMPYYHSTENLQWYYKEKDACRLLNHRIDVTKINHYFNLVDIHYILNNKEYMHTVKLDTNNPIIQLYTAKDLNNSSSYFETHFDSVVIENPSSSSQPNNKFLEKFNKYLGPMHDFHRTLAPMKLEWMNLDIPLDENTKIKLTTNLMETVEFKHGDDLHMFD